MKATQTEIANAIRLLNEMAKQPNSLNAANTINIVRLTLRWVLETDGNMPPSDIVEMSRVAEPVRSKHRK